MDRPRYVASGVELFPTRTPTLPPATHTNSYAIGTREVLLVEPSTPYEDERNAWLSWVRALASTGRHARAILLTHHHADHVGGASFFAEALKLPLWAHEQTAARLPGMRIDRCLADGEAIVLAGATPSRWQVLHTPGHAPGHLCLHEQTSGVLVVGDMVASIGTIMIAPDEGDMAEYLRQLERLAELGAAVALPAHGEPISTPSDRFRFYVAHRLHREAKVMRALEQAGRSGAMVEALVPLVYADTPPPLWPLATLSLASHLIKLEGEGRVVRAGEGWAHAEGKHREVPLQ